jgi:HSP20 family protein
MNIIRWNPFRELEDMQVRLDRMLGEVDRRKVQSDEPFAFADWAPAVDVQETDAGFVVKADLPDMKKEDINVKLADGVLTIEGERKQEEEEKGKKFHRIERQYGQFIRRFALPADVDAANVKAEFKDGVLNVHLPKAPNAKPKSVEIKVA